MNKNWGQVPVNNSTVQFHSVSSKIIMAALICNRWQIYSLVTTAIAATLEAWLNGSIWPFAVFRRCIATSRLTSFAGIKSFVRTFTGISWRSRFANWTTPTMIVAIACRRWIVGNDTQHNNHERKSLLENKIK